MIKKINIALPEDLLTKLDEHCKEYFYERSEFIRAVLRTKLFGNTSTGPINLESQPMVHGSMWDLPSSKKPAKAVTIKKKNLCQHLIAIGGYCEKCGGTAK